MIAAATVLRGELHIFIPDSSDPRRLFEHVTVAFVTRPPAPKILDVDIYKRIIEMFSIDMVIFYCYAPKTGTPEIHHNRDMTTQAIAITQAIGLPSKVLGDVSLRTYFGKICDGVAHRKGKFSELLSRSVITLFGLEEGKVLMAEHGNVCALLCALCQEVADANKRS